MRYDLDRALMCQTAMRNFTITDHAAGKIFLAQFDPDYGSNVWALEVCFHEGHGAWGWRTGARNLPRDSWNFVSPGDTRPREFAQFVTQQLRAQAQRLSNIVGHAESLLARRLA